MTPKEKYIQEAEDKAVKFAFSGNRGRAKWWANEAKRRDLNTRHLDNNLKLK